MNGGDSLTYFKLKCICKQIDDEKSIIADIKKKGYKITQNITDTPRGNKKSDKVGDTVCSLCYHEQQQKKLENMLEEHIEAIPNATIKEYITKKFCKKWTWGKIARVVTKGNLSGDTVRKICSRYYW